MRAILLGLMLAAPVAAFAQTGPQDVPAISQLQANPAANRAALGLGGAALLGAGGANGAAVLDGSGLISGQSALATGTSTPQSLASFFSARKSIRGWNPACDGTTDDSVALAAATTALRDTGSILYIPGNCRLRLAGAAQVWLRGMRIEGDAVKEAGSAGPSLYGQHGSTILLDDTTASPFVVSSEWGLSGLVFNWPRQTEAAAVANGGLPLVFPPLIVAHSNDVVQLFEFSHNQVENAYDVFDLRGTGAGAGHAHISNNTQFALRYHYRLNDLGGETFVTDNQYSPIGYLFGVFGTATTYLEDYAATNSEIFRIEGNGTTTTSSAKSVDGLRITANYALGVNKGFHVVGGSLNLATINGFSFDQVQTPLAVDSGGGVFASTITGGTWLCQRLRNTAATAPCVTVNGGAPGSSLSMANVDIAVVIGAGIVFHDPGAGNLSIVGGRIANVGNISTGNPFNGIDFSAPTGSMTLANFPLNTTATANSTSAVGLVVGVAKSTDVSGITFGGWNVPAVYNAASGAHVSSSNISYGSTAPAATLAILGPGAPMVTQSGNRWDIGSAITLQYSPTGQSNQIIFGGADANVGAAIAAKGIAGFVVNSGIGTLLAVNPAGTATQSAFALIQSAPSGGSVAYTASTGNVLVAPGSGGSTLIVTFPLCSSGIAAGTACVNSQTAGSGLFIK